MLIQFLDSCGVKENLSRPFPVFRVVYVIFLPSGNPIDKSRDTGAHKMINEKRYRTIRDCLVSTESLVSPNTVAPFEKRLTCSSQDDGHQIRALSRRFELC